MRILFAGTPEIAVPALRRIAADERFTVCGVLTNPDRIRARGRKSLPSPVKATALKLGLPVIQPERLLREGREEAAALNPDMLVVFAYGRIFGPKFLSLFPKGAINVHPSLLPKLRGSAPIQFSILDGLETSGITVQRLALEMDTGDILKQRTFALSQRETTVDLTELAAEIGADMAIEVLGEIQQGIEKPAPQDDEKATYCRKLEKTDRIIDWTKSAVQLSREIRAYYPWPKSMTMWGDKQLMLTYALPLPEDRYGLLGDSSIDTMPSGTVITAPALKGVGIVCGEGVLLATHLQLAAKKEMDWKAFLNGNADIAGTCLGS